MSLRAASALRHSTRISAPPRTLQPGLILGPPQTTRPGVSVGLVLRHLEGKFPALPNLSFAVTDVRDINRAHVRALEADAAAGMRSRRWGIRRGRPRSPPSCARSLHPSPEGSPIVTCRRGSSALTARFDASMAPVVPLLEQPATAAAETIGWRPPPAAETIAVTAGRLRELGLV